MTINTKKLQQFLQDANINYDYAINSSNGEYIKNKMDKTQIDFLIQNYKTFVGGAVPYPQYQQPQPYGYQQPQSYGYPQPYGYPPQKSTDIMGTIKGITQGIQAALPAAQAVVSAIRPSPQQPSPVAAPQQQQMNSNGQLINTLVGLLESAPPNLRDEIKQLIGKLIQQI